MREIIISAVIMFIMYILAISVCDFWKIKKYQAGIREGTYSECKCCKGDI